MYKGWRNIEKPEFIMAIMQRVGYTRCEQCSITKCQPYSVPSILDIVPNQHGQTLPILSNLIYIQAMYKQCPHCCPLSLCSELTMWRGELCAGPFTVLHSIHTLESWGLFVASEATGLQLNKLGGPIMLSPSSTFHPSSHFMLPQHPVQLQLPLCPSIHCTQPCIYCYKCL